MPYHESAEMTTETSTITATTNTSNDLSHNILENESKIKEDETTLEVDSTPTESAVNKPTQPHPSENTNDVIEDNDDDENEDKNEDDDDDENNESNDLTIVSPDVLSNHIQPPADCGHNRGGCDHECRIVFDNDPSDQVGHPECFCRSGFTLDEEDQRTCHGKFSSLRELINTNQNNQNFSANNHYRN